MNLVFYNLGTMCYKVKFEKNSKPCLLSITTSKLKTRIIYQHILEIFIIYKVL